ncbi:MAG: 16S rRNA (cytosine(1402)-N(4))-methyltransferase RsmH [Clostridiales bacterium]|nr:16S rRNA (cytosine(1402)-N(4))-methyltransferase RsmH [Clostridiales bacterium]
MEFSHVPVLLDETIAALGVKPDGIYADCTAGGGGHSYEIAKRLTGGGHLFCIDQDSEAVEAFTKRLSGFSGRFTPVHRSFADTADIFRDVELDGALMDLGVSSHQIDDAERGFSYMQDAPLDMRMDRSRSLTATDIVNGYDEAGLADVIFRWGEEKYSRQIAAAIVRARSVEPITTTARLADIVRSAVPKNYREAGGHPAKRTFQALRIETNGEIDIIEPSIRAIVDRLKPGGRIAVITFHSLEDRAVKKTFASLAKGCTCPPDFPVCVCGNKPKIRVFKDIVPSAGELETNPRAHSARLRYAERLAD